MPKAVPCRRMVVLPVLLACFHPTPSRAWWSEGHEIEARVAARLLPADVPEFFRRSGEELAYLCNEPDRWRASGKAPALKSSDVPNHWFALERFQEPLPPTRYEFLASLYRTGALPGAQLTVEDFGMAPYEIAEGAEMLTETFRMWRAAPSTTDHERQTRKQVEEDAVHAAGILCHYVTDTAQPLHASVHIQGWKAGFPNPAGYSGGTIHHRFEEYADGAIRSGKITADVLAGRAGSVKLLGGWIEEASAHIRKTNALVSKLYALDKEAPFGSGKEPQEARALVEERLAAGTEVLRNVWYTAWIKSGQ